MKSEFALSDHIAFPVILEGLETQFGKWEEIARYENAAELDFKMNSYALPCFPLMRVRAAGGQIFEFSQAQLMEFHQKVEKHNSQATEPLATFLQSAPEQALETAQELINAGIAAKHFHIPDRSHLLIEHPNLHHLRFFEFDDSVVCQVFVKDVPSTDTEPSVTIWKTGGFGVTPMSLSAEVQAFLILLCASIVRDFWVLEQPSRTTTYKKRTEKKRTREGTGKARKRVVEKKYIFIPRFRYDLSFYEKNPSAVSLHARQTLSPHLVSGHLRKLPDGWNISDTARENADHFGIHLREGYTFVKPHERGEVERLVNYRSRSAFQLIFKGE